ncbi:IS3 family transposase [Aquimarina latercula]|uniref:IS3 family transposase n=1 Tax=Aquimarina latercula TaxID=987 RepID=UPI0004850B27|nr:IS3 family transposase [Aquimarina latercula]
MVVQFHSTLSLTQQCELLEINRSGVYHKSKGESPLDLKLMKEIARQFSKHPCYGVKRMIDYLNLDLGYRMNIKRVRRLCKLMGLQTICVRPKTTIRR